MKKETRTVVYDDELRLEAYRFEGTQQPFPNHFHEYFVIGFVEDGERCLFCRNQEYVIKKGNIVLFNPGDNHGCVQNDGGAFDYRGLNISRTVMSDLAEEVTGKRTLPGFSKKDVYKRQGGFPGFGRFFLCGIYCGDYRSKFPSGPLFMSKM